MFVEKKIRRDVDANGTKTSSKILFEQRNLFPSIDKIICLTRVLMHLNLIVKESQREKLSIHERKTRESLYASFFLPCERKRVDDITPLEGRKRERKEKMAIH